VQGFWEKLMDFHALTAPNIANLSIFINGLLIVQQALFTMQTWSNILRLNESRDLFIYGIKKSNESFIFPKIALFGGIFIH